MHPMCASRIALGIALPAIAIYITPSQPNESTSSQPGSGKQNETGKK